MIRDLRFDELEQADRRRRLTRLVIVCLTASTLVTFGVSRELKIKEDFGAIPEARVGDLSSLRARQDGISGLLSEHHVWTGAFSARRELDDLMLSIHDEEKVMADVESKRKAEETRIREEAEAARVRGFVLLEGNQFDRALGQFQKALDLCDSLGEKAWDGAPWKHRESVMVDIDALTSRGTESK